MYLLHYPKNPWRVPQYPNRRISGICKRVSGTGRKAVSYTHLTEFIIMLNKPMTDKQERDFKSYLESIGDSIVVVADDEITRCV